MKLPLLLFFQATLPYWAVRPFVERFWEKFWQEEKAKEDKLHQKQTPSLRHSERAVLMECLSRFHPFFSVIDIGCSHGQMLHLLAPVFTHVSFIGVDIDPERVSGGNDVLEKEGIGNARLVNIDASNLAAFAEDSFDVAISCASLLYLDPDKFESAILEMKRISKRGFVLAELHDESAGEGEYTSYKPAFSSYWMRDYRKLFSKLIPDSEVKFHKITNALWTTEYWKDKGYVIEVRF